MIPQYLGKQSELTFAKIVFVDAWSNRLLRFLFRIELNFASVSSIGVGRESEHCEIAIS